MHLTPVRTHGPARFEQSEARGIHIDFAVDVFEMS
jgi:hypothetical protein